MKQCVFLMFMILLGISLMCCMEFVMFMEKTKLNKLEEQKCRIQMELCIQEIKAEKAREEAFNRLR